MDHGTAWMYGTAGEPCAGPGDALLLVRRAARTEPGGRVEALLARCVPCGGEEREFEVAAGECFCVGCCIPLGIADGGVHPSAYPWRLEPTAAPLPTASPGPGHAPADLPQCPAGHDVFQVAVALAFTAEGTLRSISVGLRCPEDGALCLYVDNARVVPRAA
ncbi:hypothetical protein AW27_033080 [Streptomyces sp. PCS3-D2]|uniref:hypothetical protein n=1 Tax=Streptomyces sp. PCS3-D2 TaxID=1460244 RepID=UPI000A49763B|nr:hypothetical protein [Streptomyces sp. PCS3-D2]WKV75934.1 hypothetical protein AW27_033080 [Streptomyces sp. PCS3-D2]